jgi:hypothetical protein
MDRPTKILIGAVVTGLLSIGLGFAASKYFESELKNLVQACEVESQHSRATAKHEWQKAALVCEPAALSGLGDTKGIQARIVDTQRKVHAWLDSSRFLAILIVTIGVLPYAWYFLLRRIRELRGAIAGK